MDYTQYFSLKVTSPKGSKTKITKDLTPYVNNGVSYSDEDGSLESITFDLVDGFIWLDVLSLGMQIDLIGGSLLYSEPLFNGYISRIDPSFKNGNVSISVRAMTVTSKKLGKKLRDLIYPSKNHPFSWGREPVKASTCLLYTSPSPRDRG